MTGKQALFCVCDKFVTDLQLHIIYNYSIIVEHTLQVYGMEEKEGERI